MALAGSEWTYAIHIENNNASLRKQNYQIAVRIFNSEEFEVLGKHSLNQ